MSWRMAGTWTRYTRWRQTSKEEALSSELHLLATRTSEHGGHQTRVVDVSLPDGNTMHTYVTEAPASQTPSMAASPGAASTPMVLVPGYGAGAGFFFKNLPALGGLEQVYAVDLLGTGLSSRPAFSARDAKEAEDFFVQSMSDWYHAMGLEKMVLVGHSLGGYLATVYALRHPEHIKHLVLVSPAGIPKMPEDWEPAAVRPVMSGPGLAWRAAKAVWEAGITPGTVTRSLGPWGPNLVHRYIHGRFRSTGEGLTAQEAAAFTDYQYHILAQDGSGEHALRHLLEPFAWARDPLELRIPGLKVPVTFVYGDNDWMLSIDRDAPMRALEGLSAARRSSNTISAAAAVAAAAAGAAAGVPGAGDTASRGGGGVKEGSVGREGGPLDREVVILPGAGHYVFIDQPDKFHAVMEQIYEGLA